MSCPLLGGAICGGPEENKNIILMLCERDNNSTAADSSGSSFQQRLINAIRPLVEAELDARVKRVHERLLMELQVERLKNQQLGERCAMLEREVRRSQGTVEGGRAGWSPPKGDYPGQGLRVSTALPRANRPLDRFRTTVDVTVETGSLEGVRCEREEVSLMNLNVKETILLVKEAGQTSQDEDPLRELAHLIDGNSSSDGSPPRIVGLEERSPWSTDRKREATRYLAPLRGNVRKQAHAKDCPCCTKVHLIRES